MIVILVKNVRMHIEFNIKNLYLHFYFQGARSLTASTSVPGTFRDLLERRAEECNLVFMPVANKTYEAKQVYLFGRVQIYLDRRVIFMLQSMGNWIPVSMEMLVNAAR